MRFKGELKLGKVREYDGHLGEIQTINATYYFTKDDVHKDDKLLPNDLVMFKGKTEDEFPQAYYVKKINLKKI